MRAMRISFIDNCTRRDVSETFHTSLMKYIAPPQTTLFELRKCSASVDEGHTVKSVRMDEFSDPSHVLTHFVLCQTTF